MAVNVSTITSVCVYCKAQSNTVIEQNFHEIFDEMGLELQLPSLVETHFQIKVENDGKKYLCDECVNRLIELYDLQEHAKEESLSAANSKYHKEVHPINIQLDKENTKNTKEISFIVQDGCDQQNGVLLKNVCQLGDENSKENTEIILNKEVPVHEHHHESLKLDPIEISDVDGKSYKKSPAFSLEQVDIDNDFADEDYTVNNIIDEAQELTSISTMEISNSSEADESQEVIFCDIESEGTEIGHLLNINKSGDIEVHTEIYATEDQLSETENEAGNNEMYEQLDETLIENDKTFEQIDENEDIIMSDMLHCDDEDNHLEATTNTDRESNFNEIAYITVSEDSTEEVNQDTLPLNTKNTDIQLMTTNDYESRDNTFEKSQDELSNDSFSLEEEYLIEEICCSEEYDEIDLNEYLDKALFTKFQGLELKWETECKYKSSNPRNNALIVNLLLQLKLCLSNYNTFEELLKHSCIRELEETQQLCCIVKDCNQHADNLATLARHLILIHYDKLESVPIYGKCPDCQKTFSNIFDFNKHSCCRNIKRKTGAPNYCQYCDMDFQSLKRYVFHMQFHLTNRRPKVCLLCGALFKISNDFFEHTQYQHTTETAMACIKCDRFFRDKDVYDQHVISHDTKYLYSCTVCPKKYTNKFILAQHMDIYHSNKPNVMKCKHCEKEFVNRISYRNHIKCHETDVEVEVFICSTCGIVTNNRENIKYHIECDEESMCFSSHVEERIINLVFTCENCSLDYDTIKHLQQHRLSSNHSDELFVCGICRQSFKTLRHMRNHYINHKDLEEYKAAFPITRYFVCNVGDCEEFYPIWTTLYYHKKRPHKTNKSNPAEEFKCQFCQQICSSKMSLAVHVARSHNNSNVKCSYCKRGFKSQKLLQEHIDRYHTPVECDICLKKFKHRRNLESHNNLVHLSIKRYFCKHCNKGYFHKSEKNIHEKRVHPKVSYNCKLCNFVTNYAKSFQVHMDKHNNQLQFKCTICGKEFGRKQLLQCHLRRHLNKKDFVCADFLKEEGCDSTFLTYHLLKKHIQSKHPNSAYNNNLKNDNQQNTVYKNRTVTDEVKENSFELWVEEDASTSGMHINNEEDLDATEMVLEEDDVQVNV